MKPAGLGPKRPLDVRAPATAKPAEVATPKKPVAPAKVDALAPPVAPAAEETPRKTAVVSGAGPSGLLAMLKLVEQGFKVTGVEQRSDYTRHVNISLHQSYLDDVKALSPELHAKLMKITSPITRDETIDLTGGKAAQAKPRLAAVPDSGPQTLTERLLAPKVVNVSVRELEKLFFHHLQGLHDDDVKAKREPRITLLREYTLQPTLDPETNKAHVTLKPWRFSPAAERMPVIDLGTPDLLVIAEGNKSNSARAVGMEQQNLSVSKTYLSGHVPESIGPLNRRVEAQVGDEKVSLWATGKEDHGTWLLMEVPASMRLENPDVALELFLGGKELLFNPTQAQAERFKQTNLEPAREGAQLSAQNPEKPASFTTGFGGAFQFQQMLMRNPTAGLNVVAIGDAPGVTHADLSGGLELGLYDLKALGTLGAALQRGEGPQRALETFASQVYETRVEALALGMKEFYPEANHCPRDLVDTASRLAASQSAVRPHELLESLLREARAWAA